MKKHYFIIAIAIFCLKLSSAQSVFINEIHYDNAGAGIDEGVEIAGPAGTDLSSYKIQLYRADGTKYGAIGAKLTGTIPNEQNTGFGAIWFPRSSGLHDGYSGIALINKSLTPHKVIQFLSYEQGSSTVITATDGDAKKAVSTDIGVSEDNSTPVGSDLQLKGTGTKYSDFTWETSPIASTHSLINTNQTFVSGTAAVHYEKLVGVTVYPNPITDGNFMIQTNYDTTTKIEIFDVLGQKLFSKAISGRDNIINVSNLNRGIYILKMFHKNKITSRKIIVN